MQPRGIVLHTAGVRGDTTAAAMRKYHIEHNGWNDLGYHRVIRKDGTVELGRSLWKLGAHASGANDTLGVCVTGHGDYEPWTDAQREAVMRLCVEWCKHYGWDERHVCGHHEVRAFFNGDPTAKTCPGKLVDLVAFRAKLRENLSPKPGAA